VVVPSLVILIAVVGPATDAPDEGSGPARRGRARLQRMSGGPRRAPATLGPWPIELRRAFSAGLPESAAAVGAVGDLSSTKEGAYGRAASRAQVGRHRFGDRQLAHGAGAGRRRRGAVPAPVRADGGQPGPGGGRGAGRRGRRDAVGGGARADRAGVAAGGGVLRRPRAHGAPGVQPEVRGPAAVPVPARQDQRHRR